MSILEQDYDVFVRIDLDAIFFCNIEHIAEYAIKNNIQFLGAYEFRCNNPQSFYLNCGIAVYNSCKINFINEFKKFYNPSIHFCPEQDFLNHIIKNRKSLDGLCTLSTAWIRFYDENLKILHLNGVDTKPFRELKNFTEGVFVVIDILCIIGQSTKFEKIFNDNKNFLYNEFKKLPLKYKIYLISYKHKLESKWKKLFASGCATKIM